ncbi:MAG: bifunctional pyr operon transcriptional regulator/uracil phosphoribosyltransferase PyrR [Acidimicrobiales bacterium]
MSGSEERQAPTRGLAFLAKSQLMTSNDVDRALTRMAHEIIERNHSVDSLTIVGLQSGGREIATNLARLLSDISGQVVMAAMLDVSFYRDDLPRNPLLASASTTIDQDLTDRTVVVVDDVLFTGRTIRAALNALSDWGRPRAIQLCVLVDRGHRELPIRPDFVGKNLPTSRDEAIVATLDGVWIGSRGVS